MKIQTLNLLKAYFRGTANEVVAVNDVSLTVENHDLLLLTGPSGSGKTTLLSLLGLLTRPTKGKIFYDGEEVSSYSDAWQTRVRREKVGFIFQQYNLLPQFSAWENVSLPLLCQDIPKGMRKEISSNIMNRLGLKARIDFKVAHLSGGEQQRVAIARALVKDPEVIFADEPTASVDDETSAMIIDLFKDLKKEGKSIVVSTHDRSLVKEGNAQIILKNGMATIT